MRVQGYGQTQVVLSNVQPEQEFNLELRSDTVSNEFRTGIYTLTVTFSAPSQQPELLVSGNLVAGKETVEREWYVARPQLFGLSLDGVTSLPSI